MWFLVLILLQSLAVERFDVIQCTGRGGYMMRERYELLDPGSFEEGALRRHFQPLTVEPPHSEVLVLSVAEPELYRRFPRPCEVVVDPTGKHWFESLSSSAPLAYCFRFGRDTFVQYRDARGRVSWILLSGRNLFEEALGGEEFILVGYQQITRALVPCEETGRRLAFLVPQMDREKALRAARFLDERLPSPGMLDVDFFTSMEDALRLSDYQFPGLEVIPQYVEKLNRGRTTVASRTEKEFREHLAKTPMLGKQWSFHRAAPDARWLSIYEGPGKSGEEIRW
jgi:hypothetical protein